MDWQLGTMWPPLRVAVLGLTRVPEADRNYELIKKSYQEADSLLALLDQHLEKHAYCSGEQFNIGDIPLALCVSRWLLLEQTFPEKTGPRSQLSNIDEWMKRIEGETKYSVVAEKALNIVK
jgi:glutathione S-transferase